jgi:hypothetical protein
MFYNCIFMKFTEGPPLPPLRSLHWHTHHVWLWYNICIVSINICWQRRNNNHMGPNIVLGNKQWKVLHPEFGTKNQICQHLVFKTSYEDEFQIKSAVNLKIYHLPAVMLILLILYKGKKATTDWMRRLCCNVLGGTMTHLLYKFRSCFSFELPFVYWPW